MPLKDFKLTRSEWLRKFSSFLDKRMRIRDLDFAAFQADRHLSDKSIIQQITAVKTTVDKEDRYG